MTNFEVIKNLDIDNLAMMLAMDRQRTINDVFEFLKLEYKLTSDFLTQDFENIKKHLESEQLADEGDDQTIEKKVYCSCLECEKEECPRHHKHIEECYKPQEARDFSGSDECLNSKESR